MNEKVIQILEGLISHLQNSEGADFKSAYDESCKPPMPVEELGEDGKPKGLAIEKVSIMGKPEMGEDSPVDNLVDSMGGKKEGSPEDEMSDEEIKELLSKLG